MYKGLTFDPATAFTPIADIANSPMVLVGGGKGPYNTLQEVMENNKGKDKPLYYGTAGVGTPMHLAGELLRSEEHTSELQSLMRISYAVFCLNKKNKEIVGN